MNAKLMAAVAVLLLAAPFSYVGGKKEQNAAPKTQGASSQQTSAAQPAPSANPYFTGDGGKGRSITILPPIGVFGWGSASHRVNPLWRWSALPLRYRNSRCALRMSLLR